MRAGVYLRISRDAEGKALGVKRQEEDCKALAKQRGWKVTATYSDNDISAGGHKKRPGWEALLSALEKHEIDAVVAYSSSRMYRRPADLQRLIALAKANGGVEIATCVSGKIDLSTADGRMLAGILAEIDQGELERVSERQRRQIKEKK
jgi:site-specific DNA recombinase